MKLEAIATLAEWARHGTYGINALLGGIPRLSGVAVPPNVTVLDELTNSVAARQQLPEAFATLPAVLISAGTSPLEQSVPSVAPFPPDGQVEVFFRYAARNSDTAEARRDEGITLRAIWRCIPKLFVTPQGIALRQSVTTTAGVQVATLLSMREVMLDAQNTTTNITGGVLISLRCRDLHASS